MFVIRKSPIKACIPFSFSIKRSLDRDGAARTTREVQQVCLCHLCFPKRSLLVDLPPPPLRASINLFSFSQLAWWRDGRREGDHPTAMILCFCFSSLNEKGKWKSNAGRGKNKNKKAQIELNEKTKRFHALSLSFFFLQEYYSVIKREKNQKQASSLMSLFVWKPRRNKSTPLITLSLDNSVSLLFLRFINQEKEGKRKTRQEIKFSLSSSIDSIEFGFISSSRRSATGRHIWHEVKLVLTEPEFRQLIGSVQTQLHHQRHENLFVYGVKIDNPIGARALVPHADADTHPTSSETSWRPQDLVPGAQRWGTESPLSTAGRLVSSRSAGEVLVVRVELLKLHASDEMRSCLEAERLRFGERRRRQGRPGWGGGTGGRREGHDWSFGWRVVEQGGERRGRRREFLHRSVGVAREQQWGHHQESLHERRRRRKKLWDVTHCHHIGDIRRKR